MNITRADMLAALDRSRARLDLAHLSPADRARAETLIARDEAILKSARGETMAEMRRHLQTARTLTHTAQLVSMGGMALTGVAGLALNLSAQALTGSFVLFGLGGVAVMAYATFGLQKPVLGDVLDGLAPELELHHRLADVPGEVQQLAAGTAPGEVTFTEDGILIGGVFLPEERPQRLFH